MLDPSYLLDKLSCFRSNDDPFPALRSPLYQPKPPPLMGFESNLFLPVIVESSLQRQQQQEEIVIATTTTKKDSSNPRQRKPIRNDRHSKIYTAQGLRDRRMRLSLEVARKFFALQDMLGFDKASTTVDWLITQSKSSIEQHVVNLSKGSSSPMDRFSVKAKEKGKKVGSSSSSRRKVSLQQLLSKGARAEARARARERTKEKKEKENFGGQSEEYYYGELLPFVISGESSNQNIYNNNYLIGCSSDDSLNIFQEQMNINGEFSGEFEN